MMTDPCMLPCLAVGQQVKVDTWRPVSSLQQMFLVPVAAMGPCARGHLPVPTTRLGCPWSPSFAILPMSIPRRQPSGAIASSPCPGWAAGTMLPDTMSSSPCHITLWTSGGQPTEAGDAQ